MTTTPSLAQLGTALTEGNITFRTAERYGYTRRELCDAMDAAMTGPDWTLELIGHAYVG